MFSYPYVLEEEGKSAKNRKKKNLLKRLYNIYHKLKELKQKIFQESLVIVSEMSYFIFHQEHHEI